MTKTVEYCAVCKVLWHEKCRGNLTGKRYATYKHHIGNELARVVCAVEDAPESVKARLDDPDVIDS